MDLVNALGGLAHKGIGFIVGHFQGAALSLSLIGAVLLVEILFAGWKYSSLRSTAAHWASARNDLFSFVFLASNLGTLVAGFMLIGIPFTVRKYAQASFAGIWALPAMHPILAILIFALCIELFAYWFHRACHVIPLLWSVHRYHHSATVMTILTAKRTHPIETVFYSLWFIPLSVLQVPTEYLGVYHFCLQSVVFLKHSSLQSDWGWLGRYVIQSPAAHRIHHSIEEKHYNRNYAQVFQFWDVLFGTAHREKDPITLGLRDDAGGSNPFRYIMSVYIDFLAALRDTVTRKRQVLPMAKGLIRDNRAR